MSSRTDRIEASVGHRPWPLPSMPWIMFQSWRRLLFAHWRISTDALRPLVPKELELDEHDGSAWVGLTPFVLASLQMRFFPPVPGLSRFPEMNLRTYVRRGDRAGVFFFSLDAASRTAAAAARLTYRLPYFHADMSVRREGEWVRYTSRRRASMAEFSGRYRPLGASFQAAPNSLEAFLTERYALFTVLRSGRVLSADIHHAPWRLRAAEAAIEMNTVPLANGITFLREPTLLHYSARQDTLVWAPAIVN